MSYWQQIMNKGPNVLALRCYCYEIIQLDKLLIYVHTGR